LSQEVWPKAYRAIGGFRGEEVDSMKEETKKTTEEELTRRHFLKGGAGAVLVASCLPALDLPGTTTKARAGQNAAAQGTSAIISGGERLTLPSKILGENRTVFVSLPSSYPRSVQSYPVLYLTDAQWNFEHTRATAAFLARNMIIPEIIIVGVTNPDRTRDLYATRADFKHNGRTIPFPNSGNADRFLEFLEKELIPWTEGAYRTAPLRILAGHSAGGNFALHAMRVKPALFQAVMAASPWLAWDDRKELKELVPFLASAQVLARTFFFTYADEGPDMKADIDALTSALRSRIDTSLRWDSAAYPNESHDSTVIKSYYDALRMIFAGWSYPRDPQTNFLKGSLDDVKAHYRRLGERLGFALLPPEAIVNELGYQRLRMNNLDEALAAFRFNTEQNPQSANVWDSLGEALERAGKKEEALRSYRKAVSVAEAKGDPNLEGFRKQVARLSEILRSGKQ
jgi:predicted alpha/beta superfamily hydrolase